MATIRGTSGNDTIAPLPLGVSVGVIGGIPSDEADSINGGAGDDFIDGGGGNDTLIGPIPLDRRHFPDRPHGDQHEPVGCTVTPVTNCRQ